MNYVNAVKYLSSLPRGVINIERAHKICNECHLPYRQLKVIHICGRDGKNSCHKMLSSIIQKSGLSVGNFSPYHFGEIRESIAINDQTIPHGDFADLISRVADAYSKYDDILPSFEEALCLSAIIYFSERGCDIAILEKSVSKNDAANISEPPLITVLSSMADADPGELSFSELFRRGTQETVTCPQHKDIYAAISESCVNTGSRLTVPIYSEFEINKINLFNTFFTYRGVEYLIPSFAPCQTINAITVIEAANALIRLGVPITEEHIVKGLACSRLPNKCEAISLSPAIIVSNSASVDRLDSLVAAIAQIKPLIEGDIKLVINEDHSIETEKLTSTFRSSDIFFSSITKLPSNMTTARLARSAKNLLSTLTPNSALIVLGSDDFVNELCVFLKKELNNI